MRAHGPQKGPSVDLKPYRKAEYPLRTDELTHHQWTSRRYDEQLKRSDHWMQYTEVAPRKQRVSK